MREYLSLQVWTASEIALMIFSATVLLAITAVFQTTLFGIHGAISGIFGGVLLRHLALHGWTPLRSKAPQLVVLFVLWLIALIIGGIVATQVGF